MRKTISRARAYYELKAESKKAQEETIRAAGLYQMANSIYRAAKETIMLAEEKLTHEGQTAELSTAWQEMLNHATIRVSLISTILTTIFGANLRLVRIGHPQNILVYKGVEIGLKENNIFYTCAPILKLSLITERKPLGSYELSLRVVLNSNLSSFV